MSNENKKIISCDLCNKEKEYTIYNSDDLDRIPSHDYKRIVVMTPDYELGQIGYMNKDILACVECINGIVYNRLDTLISKIKKWFKSSCSTSNTIQG